MPLHLLGKKSWNVYNPKNIERVRRDEAAAKARDEAEEQRQQEVDAERRLAILRGETLPPIPPPPQPSVEDESHSQKRSRNEDPGAPGWGRERRKRKRVGEDDTDFELRLAREQASATKMTSDALVNSTSNAPIVDHTGHIDLFPEERSRVPIQKNEEAEREAAKKKREYEDQYTMRFSNAAGKEGLVGPWYAKGGDIKDVVDGNLDAPSKDVWGNEDPRRKGREAARVVANDPLAMMKRGAAKIREVEKERQKLNEERERELKQLRKEEKRRERRRRREGRKDYDDLEGFTLDGTASSKPPARSKDDDDHYQHRRYRHSREESGRSRRHSEHREHKEHEYDHQKQSSRLNHQEQDQGLSKHDRRREGRADNY
ncbi:homocitrate synthase [Daldinia childiae]|uniref:homocitrate synthase n=1 Tax=Daldinia childiae TaxID=326645 RepID=UPI001445AD23|nr:homocitrate synthase [Daldinia childiae]KAF3067205.1 homocitrate synthase [Daldinia childiae]